MENERITYKKFETEKILQSKFLLKNGLSAALF